MRPRYSQKKIRRDIAPQVFLVCGLVMSALLLTFVLQQLPARDTIVERMTPDYEDILPPGATIASNEVEIAELPQSTYVAAFRLPDGTSLALISWDRVNNKFALVSTLALSNEDGPSTEPVTISAESLGRGAPPAIIVRAKLATDAVRYHLILRQGNELVYAKSRDEKGMTGEARFDATISFSLADVDGDGDKDAVQETTPVTSMGRKPTSVVTVYAWTGTGFTYDAELTRLYSLRKSVFPEPAGSPTELVPTEPGVN